jgi:hypothetical protein
MRLLMPNQTPLTKLYQPDPLKPPTVSDPKLLQGWVDEPMPISDENFLIAKIPLRPAAFGLRALYGTLRLMDDRTADFVIQPPKDQRILDVRKDLNQLAIKMQTAMQDLVPNINSAKLGRASMNIELKFTQLPPKDIRQKVASRIGGLTTLFQRIVPPKDEQKPFLSLRYKAVSNFKTDDRINSYLTYYFSRKGAQAGDQAKYAPEIAKEFQITEDEAIQYIAKFLTEKTQVTVSDSDGKDFLSLNNPGIDISIFSQNVNTFIIQLFNLRAVTLEDIGLNCPESIEQQLFVCTRQAKVLHFMASTYANYDFMMYYPFY